MLILACANCGSLNLVSTGFSAEFYCNDCKALLQLWSTKLVNVTETIIKLKQDKLNLVDKSLPA